MGGEDGKQHDVERAAAGVRLRDGLGNGRRFGDDLSCDGVHRSQRGHGFLLAHPVFDAVVDHLGVERDRLFHLVGGQLAERMPERIQKLGLVHRLAPRFTYS